MMNDNDRLKLEARIKHLEEHTASLEERIVLLRQGQELQVAFNQWAISMFRSDAPPKVVQ